MIYEVGSLVQETQPLYGDSPNPGHLWTASGTGCSLWFKQGELRRSNCLFGLRRLQPTTLQRNKKRFKHLLKRTVSIYRWLQAGYNEATFALRHPWGTVGTWLAPSHPAGMASPANLKGDARLPPKSVFFPRCPGLRSLGIDSWRTRKTLPKKAMSGPPWSSLQHGHPTLCKLFHFYLISSQDRACQHQNQTLKGGLHKMSRAKPSLRSTASEYVEGMS